ncbi:hypothetical protein J5X84_38415 [Streptosporangiaceae bacterium NEAU-GS5]|nr:hypothetical protein [Streptosporangiaceae bacterium NEAU-GS5]
MEFLELLDGLNSRYGLLLPDRKYHVLVGFILGFDAATDFEALDGFHEWAAQRYLGKSSSLGWPLVVASKFIPGLRDGSVRYAEADTSECDDVLRLELLAALKSFWLENHDGREGSP